MDDIKTISRADKRLGGDLGEVDGTLKPLLKCEYVMKALQNGSHINDLTWNSTGDKSNYNEDGAIKYPVWHRCGISCCADGDDETPNYIVGDYDRCIEDTHGNKNFKAVMIRGDLKVTVPAYTTASVYVTMASSLFKYGGATSSTWSDVSFRTPIFGKRSAAVIIRSGQPVKTAACCRRMMRIILR